MSWIWSSFTTLAWLNAGHSPLELHPRPRGAPPPPETTYPENLPPPPSPEILQRFDIKAGCRARRGCRCKATLQSPNLGELVLLVVKLDRELPLLRRGTYIPHLRGISWGGISAHLLGYSCIGEHTHCLHCGVRLIDR